MKQMLTDAYTGAAILFKSPILEGNFPLFISSDGDKCLYMGTYRLVGARDDLSGNEMNDIPLAVKRQWAELLHKGTSNPSLMIDNHPYNGQADNINILIKQWPPISIGWYNEGTGKVRQSRTMGGPEAFKKITADHAKQITGSQIFAALGNVCASSDNRACMI